jgi:hypothetical protein
LSVVLARFRFVSCGSMKPRHRVLVFSFAALLNP